MSEELKAAFQEWIDNIDDAAQVRKRSSKS